jgi:FixH
MTMNWGYKLFFTFIVFAVMMSYLVYRAFHTDFQLVEKEYYKSELRYQEVIDGANRVNLLSSGISINQDKEGISLQLPEEMKNKQVEGNIWFYCAYNAAKDKKLDLKPDVNGRQVIPPGALMPGGYTVKVQWKQEAKDYYSEKNFVVQ